MSDDNQVTEPVETVVMTEDSVVTTEPVETTEVPVSPDMPAPEEQSPPPPQPGAEGWMEAPPLDPPLDDVGELPDDMMG